MLIGKGKKCLIILLNVLEVLVIKTGDAWVAAECGNLCESLKMYVL